MQALAELLGGLLLECKEDHVGLWSILWEVRNVLGVQDAQEARRLTLELVRDLLETGDIQAGFPASDGRGFNRWQLTTTETLARIEAEWDALGHEPNIGEVVWFTTLD